MVMNQQVQQLQPPVDVIDEIEGAEQWAYGVDALAQQFLQGAPAPAAPQPAFPDTLLLGALLDGRLRVREPFEVAVAQENADFMLEAVEVSEFGFGINPSEALADLQRAIGELYTTLEVDQKNLGRDLVEVWAILQRKADKIS